MNSQQLQTAIDKCMTIVIEKGTNLKQYQPHFYEKLCEATLKMLNIQAVRASLPSYPTLKAQTALDRKAENARELGLDYD
jgi:hypothetical protein